jgi:radical SAM protein with 4Fe4S-binding SPASM domain
VHSLAIELTAFCNQHCDYCYNAWREDGGASVGTPERAVLLARIDRVLDAVSLRARDPHGGRAARQPSSLSRPRSPAGAAHSRADDLERRPRDPGDRRALARHRLLSVLVTLNGPDAALHDAQVGGTHFESTLRGIALLRAAPHPVSRAAIVISTRRNADRVAETLRLFLSLGVRKVALSRFSPAGLRDVSLARELMPSRTHVTRALEDAAAVSRESGVQLFSTMPIPPCAVELTRFPEIEFHDCPIGTPRQEFALGPEGEIRHCALHRDPIAGARDVLDPSLDVATLFAPGDPHRYRATLPSYCAGCEHASTCAGGCGAAALWVRGRPRGGRPVRDLWKAETLRGAGCR